MGFTSARPSAVLGALRVRGRRVGTRPLRGLAPLDRLRRSPALRAGRVKSRRPDSVEIKPPHPFLMWGFFVLRRPPACAPAHAAARLAPALLPSAPATRLAE